MDTSGNGIKLVGKCNKKDLAITNTMYTPRRKNKKKLGTWTSGDGERRTLGDIIISGKRRNWVKKVG